MKFKTVQFIFIFGVAFEFSALRSRVIRIIFYSLPFTSCTKLLLDLVQFAWTVGRIYKLKRAGKQKYWRCSKDKEGCGGAVWTDLEVPAGIDRKDHVETCRVDEHLAYID
ncbi:hypothetical protein T06_15562 [Trichinella sp. T6]|nr:hypothetical protein T06_15562 [Trichinella sp. T6]